MAVLPPESIYAPSKNGGISGKTLDTTDRDKEPIRSVSREEKLFPLPACPGSEASGLLAITPGSVPPAALAG